MSEHWRISMDEARPAYILAIRAQALDEVQELIQPSDGPWVDPPLPTREQWDRIVRAAFPPPPMAVPKRLAVEVEGDGRPEGCICLFDGPGILWNTECPVHSEFASHLARRVAERQAGS
jgi:hypothetical protein